MKSYPLLEYTLAVRACIESEMTRLDCFNLQRFTTFNTDKKSLLEASRNLHSSKKYNTISVHHIGMITSDFLKSILVCIHSDFITAYGSTIIVPSTEDNLRRLLKTQHSYVTVENIETNISNEYASLYISQRKKGLFLKTTHNDDVSCVNIQKITSISWSDIFLVDGAMAYSCFIYSDNTELAFSHIYSHLKHSSSISSKGKVHFSLLLSSKINLERINSELNGEFLQWTPSDMPNDSLWITKKYIQ